MQKFIFTIAVLISTPALALFETSLTHTHLKLEPVSLENSYRVASVCFLGLGCGDDENYNKTIDDFEIDAAQQCKNHGFNLTKCTSPEYLDIQCPYDSAYYSNCKSNPPRACNESGYVLSCEIGEILDSSHYCPYDTSYKKCICDSCEGFNYTYAEATVEGYVADGSCVSCSKIKYKRKVNDCNGFGECECGSEIGADICLSGNIKKFANCKSCYVPCSGGNIDVNNYWCGGVAKCFFK